MRNRAYITLRYILETAMFRAPAAITNGVNLSRSFLFLLPFAVIVMGASVILADTAISAETLDLGVFEAYIKIAGAAIAGLAALFGIPIVVMNYRKTQAEIAKLELEAQALRQKALSEGADTLATLKLGVEDRADSRILSVLLLILNCIICGIYLAISGFIFSHFDIVGGGILMTALAAILLLPLAKQAREIIAALTPEMNAAQIDYQAALSSRIKYSVAIAIVGLIGMAVAFVVLLIVFRVGFP